MEQFPLYLVVKLLLFVLFFYLLYCLSFAGHLRIPEGCHLEHVAGGRSYSTGGKCGRIIQVCVFFFFRKCLLLVHNFGLRSVIIIQKL